MKKRLLLITGSPGSGKTTVLLNAIEALKVRGYSVSGMISREVRTCGTRVGFEILDLSDGRRGWLAHVNQKQGPRVGRYYVNLDDLNNIGARAIIEAAKNFDVVAIDEIGPMELHSERFREAVESAVESGRLLIGTIHWKMRSNLTEKIKAREDTEIYKVTYENRRHLHELIVEKAAKFMAKTTRE